MKTVQEVLNSYDRRSLAILYLKRYYPENETTSKYISKITHTLDEMQTVKVTESSDIIIGIPYEECQERIDIYLVNRDEIIDFGETLPEKLEFHDDICFESWGKGLGHWIPETLLNMYGDGIVLDIFHELTFFGYTAITHESNRKEWYDSIFDEEEKEDGGEVNSIDEITDYILQSASDKGVEFRLADDFKNQIETIADDGENNEFLKKRRDIIRILCDEIKSELKDSKDFNG